MVERRHLGVELFLQHLHLTGRVVEHLAGGGSVGHQLTVALLLLAGLHQLLAGSRNLAFHVGLLTLVDLLGGSLLHHLEPYLRGVDESHLTATLQFVTFVDVECQQRTVLLGRHRGLGGLESACGIIGFLFVSASGKHKGYAHKSLNPAHSPKGEGSK